MNRRKPGPRGKSTPSSRPQRKPVGKRPPSPERSPSPPAFDIVERKPAEPGAFRILIAIHRPRYRGRAERAAAREGWEVVSLRNKQDVVGQVARPPRPPDILLLSGDFGRQRDYAIFRAVQAWRAQGMRLIGLVEDCETAPEGFPDSVPARLCDICLTPPCTTADLRALFARCYEEMRGRPAPPLRKTEPEEISEEDDDF